VDDDDLEINPKNLAYKPDSKVLDLTSTLQDYDYVANRPDVTMRPGSSKDSLGLIRKFNRHSELVLQSSVHTSKKPRLNDLNAIYLAVFLK
jgi:transcription initiation factor TFIIH subunit 1